MVITDPIGDMLNRIKNAQAVNHQTVTIPFSKLKYNLAKILEKQGFINGIDTQGRSIKKTIVVNLKYDKQGKPVIHGLKRISKPGQRIYLTSEKIKPVREGFGSNIISTSQGLMTGKEAKKKRIGGEVLLQIW